MKKVYETEDIKKLIREIEGLDNNHEIVVDYDCHEIEVTIYNSKK